MHLAFDVRTQYPEFGDQILEHFLTDDRVDDLFDHTVRLIDGGFRHFVQQPRLAAHLLERGELLLVDLFFGSRADGMDDLQQHVDQPVSQLLPPAPAKHGHHAIADRRRMAAQFTDGLCGAALAELVDELDRYTLEHLRNQADNVDGLAPFDAEQQVIAAGFAEIGFELREGRGRVDRVCTVVDGVGIITRQHPVDDRLAGGGQARVNGFL